MFSGINLLWARLRPNLAQTARRGLKWILESAQKFWKATLEGMEKLAQENESPWARSTHFLCFFTDEWN